MKKQLQLLVKRIWSLVPTPLPIGVTEFEKWSDSIYDLAPYADRDSIKFTLATMIMHLGPQRSRVAKNHFVRSLRKTAANQVAHARMTEIKLKKDAEAKAAQQLAEETAAREAAANVEKTPAQP